MTRAALPTCEDQLQSPEGCLVAPHSARNPLQSVQQVSVHHRYLQGPRRGQVSAQLAACFLCQTGCSSQGEAHHGSYSCETTALPCCGQHRPACLLHRSADEAVQCSSLLSLLKGHVQLQDRCPGCVLSSSCWRGAALNNTKSGRHAGSDRSCICWDLLPPTTLQGGA